MKEACFSKLVHIYVIGLCGQGGEAMLLGIPWWVFICIASIFYCGYMAFRAIVADKKIENQFIEREGTIYLERMEAERASKQRQHSSE